MYAIRFSVGVERELMALTAYDRALVLDSIDKHLSQRSDAPTRRKKMLEDLRAPEEWSAQPPIWQLRVEELRVFYDVDRAKKVVWIRAIRRKPAHKTTGEIV